MAKRTPRQQSKHDKGVQKSAEYYEEQGYNVQADIPGYDKPRTIGGRRPDVIARNQHETVIVEVETKDSLEKDRDQQETFKEYADEHENVRFRRRTV